MALLSNLDSSQTLVGVAAPEAYTRIEAMVFDSGTGVQVTVSTYFDQAARQSSAPIRTQTFYWDSFDHANETMSPKTQIYAWLKTTPDFSGATDI
jgi:hypothetical protein